MPKSNRYSAGSGLSGSYNSGGARSTEQRGGGFDSSGNRGDSAFSAPHNTRNPRGAKSGPGARGGAAGDRTGRVHSPKATGGASFVGGAGFKTADSRGSGLGGTVKRAAEKKRGNTALQGILLSLLAMSARSKGDAVDYVESEFARSGNASSVAFYESGAVNYVDGSAPLDSSGVAGVPMESYVSDFINDRYSINGYDLSDDGVLKFNFTDSGRDYQFEFAGFVQDQASGNFTVNETYRDREFHRLYPGRNFSFPVLNVKVTDLSAIPPSVLDYDGVESLLTSLSGRALNASMIAIPPSYSHSVSGSNREVVLDRQARAVNFGANDYVVTGALGTISNGQFSGSLKFAESDGTVKSPDSQVTLRDLNSPSRFYCTAFSSNPDTSSLLEFTDVSAGASSSRTIAPEVAANQSNSSLAPQVAINNPRFNVPSFGINPTGATSNSYTSVARSVKNLAPAGHSPRSFYQISYPTGGIRVSKYDTNNNQISDKTLTFNGASEVLSGFTFEGPNGNNIQYLNYINAAGQIRNGFIEVSDFETVANGGPIDVTELPVSNQFAVPAMAASGSNYGEVYRSGVDGSMMYKLTHTDQFIAIDGSGSVSVLENSVVQARVASGALSLITRSPISFNLISGERIVAPSISQARNYRVDYPGARLTHTQITPSNVADANQADTVTITAPANFALAEGRSLVVEFASEAEMNASNINFRSDNPALGLRYKVFSRDDASPYDVAGDNASLAFDSIAGVGVANLEAFDATGFDNHFVAIDAGDGRVLTFADRDLTRSLQKASEVGIEGSTTSRTTTDPTTLTSTTVSTNTVTTPTTRTETTRTTVTSSTSGTSTTTISSTTTSLTTGTSTTSTSSLSSTRTSTSTVSSTFTSSTGTTFTFTSTTTPTITSTGTSTTVTTGTDTTITSTGTSTTVSTTGAPSMTFTPTNEPTNYPTTEAPTTNYPTLATRPPVAPPSQSPTVVVVTSGPTEITKIPTGAPITIEPTAAPPTQEPGTISPTANPRDSDRDSGKSGSSKDLWWLALLLIPAAAGAGYVIKKRWERRRENRVVSPARPGNEVFRGDNQAFIGPVDARSSSGLARALDFTIQRAGPAQEDESQATEARSPASDDFLLPGSPVESRSSGVAGASHSQPAAADATTLNQEALRFRRPRGLATPPSPPTALPGFGGSPGNRASGVASARVEGESRQVPARPDSLPVLRLAAARAGGAPVALPQRPAAVLRRPVGDVVAPVIADEKYRDGK